MSTLRKAIFLDRDGVINSNEGRYYTWKPEDLKINPGVTNTLRILKERGFMLIVITNQGGISRGEYTREDAETFHHHLNIILEQEGAEIDEFCYCPHHSDIEKCLCRKPLGLMIEKALARFNIDPHQSFMIGDSQRDIEAGEAVCLKTIFVKSNGDLSSVLGLRGN